LMSLQLFLYTNINEREADMAKINQR